MNIILKIGVYIVMFIPAAIIAGIYGAVHDQISYSFSQEYFTHFKFIQFSIPWAQESHRLGVAFVGALATWWMGVLVFAILGLFGFMFPTPLHMAKTLTFSLCIVTLVALITGLLGLIYSYFYVNENNIIDYSHWIRPGVSNTVQFVRVGFMHNASYLGGITGLVSGIIYLLTAKKSYNKSKSANA